MIKVAVCSGERMYSQTAAPTIPKGEAAKSGNYCGEKRAAEKQNGEDVETEARIHGARSQSRASSACMERAPFDGEAAVSPEMQLSLSLGTCARFPIGESEQYPL